MPIDQQEVARFNELLAGDVNDSLDETREMAALVNKRVASLETRVAALEITKPPVDPPPPIDPPPAPGRPPAPVLASMRPWEQMGGDADASRGQLPDSLVGSYYARFFWDDIHTGPRTINFRVFDDWFVRAARAGRRLSWRLNPLSPGDGGDTDHPGILWMRDGGFPGFSFDWQSQQGGPVRRLWHFDIEAPAVRNEIEWLARQLAARIKTLQAEYGGGIEYSDMLGLGLWGEYHFNNWDGSTPAGVRVPSAAAYKWGVDLWHDVFAPLGPLVFTLKAPSFHRAAGEANAYACNELRWGWRTDGWGDPWHHAVYYPAAIRENGLADWWKVNLVALEPAAIFQGWNADNYRLAYDFARLHRATKYHNKGFAIPSTRIVEMRRLFTDAQQWAPVRSTSNLDNAAHEALAMEILEKYDLASTPECLWHKAMRRLG